jgi:hypothetical protein
MGFNIRNKPHMKMETLMSRIQVIMLLLCCVAIVGCGKKNDEPEAPTPPAAAAPSAMETPAPGGPQAPPDMSDQEKAREYIQQQMAQMEARVAVIDAKAAYALALPEAQKWDAQAKLYQLKGEKKLTAAGTAAMWSAYFAVQTDARDTPRSEQGKKCTVLVTDGRVVKVDKRETPEDIKFSAPCYAFLPADWLNSAEVLTKCLAALKDKRGAGVDNAELKRLICSSEDSPVWKLSASVDGSSASATIDAVTGQVQEAR